MLRILLEHLLEVLEDGLLKVLALLDVEGLKFFSDYPRDLFEILLSHINLEEQRRFRRMYHFHILPVSRSQQSPVSKCLLCPACLQVQL